jgi:hypothetical protein
MRGSKIALLVVGGIAAIGLSIALLVRTQDSVTARESTSRSQVDKPPSHFNPPREEMRSAISPDQGMEASVASADSPVDGIKTTADQEKKLRELVLGITRRIYEDIATAAGLSDGEAESLTSLLVEQQLEIFKSDIDPTSSVAGAEEYRALLSRHRAAIAALVGTPRATAVANYQKSLDARFQVEELRRQLESVGMPLTEEQRRGVIKAAIENGAYIPMPEFSGGESIGAMSQELLARGQQRDQALLQAARAWLKPSQLHWYDDYLQQRNAAMENSIRESAKKAG